MTRRSIPFVIVVFFMGGVIACGPLPEAVATQISSVAAGIMPEETATIALVSVPTATPSHTQVPAAAPTSTDGPIPTAMATSIATAMPTVAGEPTAPRLRQICDGRADAVVLIVDPALDTGIRPGLDQFETDLCSDGYAVIERLSDFVGPADVRTFLVGLHSATGENLTGAVLIGDIPYAYQHITITYTNPDIPPLEEEVISFQYYADLDGTFDISPGYASPGGHPDSYDLHSGEVDWELWIGVLPLYKGDYGFTIQALNQYFEKNHAYRAGQYAVPRAFLQVTEHHSASTSEEHNQRLDSLTVGPYAWTPFSNGPHAYIHFNSPPGGLSVAQGYSGLLAGLADFTVADAHGYWGGHGQIDIAWAESNPVNTVFFWSNGCAVGNLDHADNFLTSVLYSPTSKVLVAKGTTNDSGGMGTNEDGFFGHNIATALSQDRSLGEAIMGHVNVPLIWPWSDSREFHFATVVVLGDPTLTVQP